MPFIGIPNQQVVTIHLADWRSGSAPPTWGRGLAAPIGPGERRPGFESLISRYFRLFVQLLFVQQDLKPIIHASPVASYRDRGRWCIGNAAGQPCAGADGDSVRFKTRYRTASFACQHNESQGKTRNTESGMKGWCLAGTMACISSQAPHMAQMRLKGRRPSLLG